MSPERRARTGLVWRLYAVGVVQFLLVALSALLIGYVVARLPHWDMQTLSARLKPVANDPVALDREIRKLYASDKLLISLYDDDNHLLVSNIEPALRAPRFGGRWHPPPRDDDRRPANRHPPPQDDPNDPHGAPPPPPLGAPPFAEPPSPFGEPGPGGPGGHPPPDNFARFEVNGREGLLVARFEHPKPSPLPALLTLISGLLVLGVGAFFTARWIARPLSRLAGMAVSLGQGDLRARSELERNDELGEVARAFDEMAERIQKLLHAEKELLANVAHELRTPLARIRVALEIAAEGDAETARASLAEIAVDLAELEALINDVLTAARFELVDGVASGSSFSLHLEPIRATMIAERAAARFRVRHAERVLDLRFEGPRGMLNADPMLLRRVLDNLLENAHKYSPDSASKVELAVSGQAAHVCFEVTDHGIGISASDLPRIFTPFFRSERSRSRGSGGVGLGLTLAQRIVAAHGGTIEASSTVGRGTLFRVLLPTAPGSSLSTQPDT